MGLRDIINKAAQNAIKIVADLGEVVVYERITIGAYDPVTDAQSQTVTNVTLTVIPTKERVTEDDKNETDPSVKSFILSSLDLGFEPKAEDSFTLSGVRYQVVRFKFVPGRSIYILSVRQS